MRAIEQLYGSAEFDARRELGPVPVGLAMKNGKLKELPT